MKILKNIFALIFLMSILHHSFGQGMKVKPGTNTIVGTSTTLKVAGGGSLTLEDDQTYAPSLVEKGNLAFTGGGDLKVQQYLEKTQWHVISSPVSNENINAYVDMYLYSHDEPTAAFTNLYHPVTTPLNPGQGYHVWSVAGAPDIVSLNGSSNKSDVLVTLSVTDASNSSGWNLLGNPFPCVVDWNGNASWALNNVSSTVYLFDNGAGNYKTWNFGSGIGTNGKSDGYIAATQGFWVRSTDTIGSQASYSLTIPASERVASPSTEFYKDATIEDNILRVSVQNETYSDECILAFHEESTEGFDNDFDAYKLFSETPSPKMYTVSGNTKQAVNVMPSIDDHETVQLFFLASTEGEFTLEITGMESFPDDIPIYLEDKQENVFQNLRENPSYAFNSTAPYTQDRFSIYFKSSLGIENPSSNSLSNVHIYSWENTVIVNTPAGFSGNVFVYDLPGKIIASDEVFEGKNSIRVGNTKGYYIVRVISSSGTKTEKVYIQ